MPTLRFSGEGVVSELLRRMTITGGLLSVCMVLGACCLTEPVFGFKLVRYDRSSPKIEIFKGRQILKLHEPGETVREYRVCIGINREGHKRITGDKRTPEGRYYICMKKTDSKFHKFLGISYPGEYDAKMAFRDGIISKATRDRIIRRSRQGKPPPWNTKLGGWVGIHGYPTKPYLKRWASLMFPKPHNWTDGCIAMWDFEIEELFSKVNIGTPVIIHP
jgi:murein L,D-transpeptidase YafK